MSAAANTEKEKPPAPQAPPAAIVVDHPHVHPQGVREVEIGRDPEGRRIIQVQPDRQMTYSPRCKGCIQADQRRMAAPPGDYDLSATMFLIPEPEYDNMVARAYLAQRYPEAEHIVHQFNADKLSYVKGSQVVVITRRGLNGKSGPRWKREKDEEGTFNDVQVAPETYIKEIVESDPIVVSECVQVTAGTMYAEESADFRELMARIAERAVPFRIAPPQHPDKLYVMRLNS